MVVALACAIGLHWAFLHSFDWAIRLADIPIAASFPATLRCTFDGQDSCARGKAIAGGEETEKKSANRLPTKKIDGLMEPTVLALFPPASTSVSDGQEARLEALAYAPPKPPPRST